MAGETIFGGEIPRVSCLELVTRVVMARVWRRVRRDRFTLWLSAVTATGLVVRLVYVLGFRRNYTVTGDPYFYHYGANLLVHGKGFIAPLQYIALHVRLEAADHPPLYMLFLAIPSAFGLGTTLAHMVWSAGLGTATVAVTGLVGRRVAGPRVGLIAAAIVAVSPNVWTYDGAVLSETMAIFVATVALLMAYRAWEQPSLRRVCALGGACGFAMLARSELVLLVPALLWPVALLADRSEWRARLTRAGAATLVAVAIVSPWVGYNLARFRHPVFLSAQLETTLAGSNCDDTYYGNDIGLFTETCLLQYPVPANQDESETAQTLRKDAEKYIRAHARRVPAVMAARVGRVAGVYRVRQQIDLDVLVERRERPLVIIGVLGAWATEVAAIAGVVIMRRRRGPPAFPLIVMPVVTLITVALTYATDRFRAAAETALALLAAVALDAVWQRMRARAPGSSRPHQTTQRAGDDLVSSDLERSS
jgi:4-amino-4-deoxy-L-arabinose transferase-like glycosyltransferase